MKKLWLLVFLLFMLCGCGNVEQNFLYDYQPFTADSLINVVIEIPAGTNQKWEVNKKNGRIEWERVTSDSMRIIDYLAYPANYGFVPQTYLPEFSDGDGDPVDVFVLGPAIPRETVVSVKILGIIHILDDGESDSKLLAVDAESPVLNVKSLAILEEKYPGVVDIIKLWLMNYKGMGNVEFLSVNDEEEAVPYLLAAHVDYLKTLGLKK
jgi:inorganic pyrophosphatase